MTHSTTVGVDLCVPAYQEYIDALVADGFWDSLTWVSRALSLQVSREQPFGLETPKLGHGMAALPLEAARRVI
jgi:hypothetical protein